MSSVVNVNVNGGGSVSESVMSIVGLLGHRVRVLSPSSGNVAYFNSGAVFPIYDLSEWDLDLSELARIQFTLSGWQVRWSNGTSNDQQLMQINNATVLDIPAGGSTANTCATTANVTTGFSKIQATFTANGSARWFTTNAPWYATVAEIELTDGTILTA